MLRFAWFGLFLAFAGCSAAETDKAASGPCAERHGVFLVHWVQHPDGHCPDLPDQMIDLDAPASSGDPSCTSSVTPSADNCSNQGTVTCSGGKQVSSCRWSTDGRSGTCTATLTLSTCVATFDVTYTKQ